jgi:hypothetical protein
MRNIGFILSRRGSRDAKFHKNFTEISQFLRYLFKEERKKVLSHLSGGEFSRNSAKIQQFYWRLKVKS